MALTSHQQEVIGEVMGALSKGHKRVVMQGSAGVGKTFAASELVDFAQKSYSINPNYNNGLIYITAPTNKALSILQKKIPATSRTVFKTIHSAIKMKRVIDKRTGGIKFISGFDKSKDQDFRNCRLCIVDECSMLNTHFLGGMYVHPSGEEELVRGYLEGLDMPILFIGDDKQLNPVGEPYGSPVFHKDYPTFELKEIIRQGEGNPIIELSRDLDLIFFKRPKLIDGKGYVYDNNKIGLIDALAEVNGTDELKYLAYINTEIDWMNKAVRERRYGNPKRIEKLETIVMNAPFGENFTNKEVKVESLDIVTDWVQVPASNCRYDGMDEPIGPFNKIKMRYYLINETIRVVHEDSDTIYDLICKELALNAKNYGWNWKSHYWFKESFADIKYNHAITVHKSQGSTYKTAILNIKNILLNQNSDERTRMLYTGVTRASDLVILNNV
jgi:hypothetical protein